MGRTNNKHARKYKELHVSSSSIADMVFLGQFFHTKHAMQVSTYQTLWRFKGGPYLQLCPCILKSTEMSSKYFSSSVVGTRDFKWHILHQSQKK
jgi:hypothetical protein